MQYLNPMGAWALGAMVVVLAFYLLKRQYNEHIVPSTYLWRMALKDQTASRPFERLRRNLLLLLQLLAVLLIALALMRPSLFGGPAVGEAVIILDASASMQAEESGRSRMQMAISQAESLIRGMREGDSVTVVRAGTSVDVLVSRVTDKQSAISALRAVRTGNGSARMEEALSLAHAMGQELDDLAIYVFSDSNEWLTGDETFFAVGEGARNRSIISLAVQKRADGLRALARVANYAPAGEITLEAYADGQLIDVRTVEAGEGEISNIPFEVPDGTQRVETRLVGADALASDDVRWWRGESRERHTAVFAGADNIFLEKALLVRGDIELIRASSAVEALAAEGAELYVFDGQLPDELPGQGAVLCVNPPEGSSVLGIQAGASKTAQADITGEGELSENLSLAGVSLRTYRPLTGGEPILTCGEDVVAAFAEQGARRAIVIGFDLHDSNLPMKYDYPVLMLNILRYLVPDILTGVSDVTCGAFLNVQPGALAEAVYATSPSGKKTELAPPFPALPFGETDEVGEYTVSQVLPGGVEQVAHFAAYIPLTEADVRRTDESASGVVGVAARTYGRELTVYLIAALVVIMLLEWWVSRREG